MKRHHPPRRSLTGRLYYRRPGSFGGNGTPASPSTRTSPW
jgi:hypothetical protein